MEECNHESKASKRAVRCGNGCWWCGAGAGLRHELLSRDQPGQRRRSWRPDGGGCALPGACEGSECGREDVACVSQHGGGRRGGGGGRGRPGREGGPAPRQRGGGGGGGG